MVRWMSSFDSPFVLDSSLMGRRSMPHSSHIYNHQPHPHLVVGGGGVREPSSRRIILYSLAPGGKYTIHHPHPQPPNKVG